MRYPLLVVLSLLLTAVLVLSGCAAGPPPSSVAPAAEPAPSLFGAKGAGTSPVDDEMLALAKSEEEIDRLLPGAAKESRGRATAPETDARKADKAPKDDQPAQPSSGDGCAIACRALASMRTSADHLCALAGEGDGRCDDARGRVRGATARVRAACPTCAAGP